MASTDVTREGGPQLFGHPRGLTFLFTTEMWERFSYYGMRAILIYYLVNYLLHPEIYDGVAGHGVLRTIVEWMFNGGRHMDIQPFSSGIYGLYTMLVYLTPVIGGFIADRWLGQRFTVIIGGVVMAIAEFVLFVPSLFVFGLLLLIVGNGFFKPNISTQVGNLYRPGDSRIDSAFSIFYVGINVGAFFSPFICGWLGDHTGYNWGFFAAGVGMVVGLITYLFALRTLPADHVTRVKKDEAVKKPMTGEDWKAVIAIILLCIPTTFFWATYEQQGNTIALWAQDFTNRAFIPGVIDWQIPAAWFQSVNPFMIAIFTPLVVALWARQSKKGKEPSTVTKMALGLFMLAVSYVVMAAAAYLSPHGNSSWLWLLGFFVFITLGELYLSPIGLALVARVAPVQILSLMMGLWFITSFTGNYLQGYIGTYFSQMDKTQFFLLCAGIGAAAGVVTWVFNFPLKPILEKKGPLHQPELAEPQADPHMEPRLAE